MLLTTLLLAGVHSSMLLKVGLPMSSKCLLDETRGVHISMEDGCTWTEGVQRVSQESLVKAGVHKAMGLWSSEA